MDSNRLLIAVLLLVSCCCAQHITVFSVEQEDGLFTVDVQTETGDKCMLEYRTRTPKVEPTPTEEKENETPAVGVDVIMKAVQGRCLSQARDWTYHVCLGADVTQTLGSESFNLGTFSRYDNVKNAQLFEQGDRCDQVIRATQVSIVCTPGHSAILSIEEPKMCSYNIIVGVPEACQNPIFPIREFTPEIASKDRGNKVDWMLRVEKSEEGVLMCEAKNIDERPAPDVAPIFDHVKLSVPGRRISSLFALNLADEHAQQEFQVEKEAVASREATMYRVVRVLAK
jgi:hypothetical protein